MDVILLMAVVFVGAAAFIASTTRKSGNRPKSLDPLAGAAAIGEAQVWALKPGDLVKHLFSGDFLVRRKVSMRKGGYRWNELYLDDAQGNQRWLSVEDNRGLDVALWTPTTVAAMTKGEPGDKNVTVSEQDYVLAEKGQVDYTTTTVDGAPVFGQMEFVEYESTTGDMVICQRFDGFERWEMAVGQQARLSDFEIFAAGGQS